MASPRNPFLPKLLRKSLIFKATFGSTINEHLEVDTSHIRSL